MDIRLDGIELTNFKGIESFAFMPGGKDATIRGTNATGKTTVADGFRWLLFGKDMKDRMDFEIKTLKDGRPVHNLDHTVEAVLLVDGEPLRLKKVYKEKWTKKRGQSRPEFTGNTTDHYIDGVPIQKKEWDVRIGDLINEDTFKLLTSPAYFNSLHWQKRREILLDVCGDVTDADVIASDKALASLPEILNGHSIEQHKKIVAARRREINGRLEEIPARIDELRKSVAEAPKNPKAIEAQISLLNKQIETAKDDAGLSALRKEKAEAEAKLAEVRNAHQAALDAQTKDGRAFVKTLEDKREKVAEEHRKAGLKSVEVEGQIKELNHSIENLEADLARLREEYDREAAHEYEGKTTCPTCGQSLPEDQVEAARAKHNEAKAQVLADINRKGKSLKERVEAGKKEVAKLNEHVATLEKEKAVLADKLSTLDAEIAAADTIPADKRSGYEKEAEALSEEVQTLFVKINAYTKPDTSGLEREVKAAQDRMADFRAAEKAKVRVGELEAEEKALSAEFERLEKDLSLMDAFTVAKVNLLEDRIAEKFEMVRFKMYKNLINGGLEEDCEAMYLGVPFSSLNSGAQINIGLDICKALSRHYGVTAPIFVDGAESITRLINMECQVIKLVVDADHPEMEVEYHE